MSTAKKAKDEGCENERDALLPAPGLLVRMFLLAGWHWQIYARIDWEDRTNEFEERLSSGWMACRQAEVEYE